MRHKLILFVLIVTLFVPEFLSGQRKLDHTLTSKHYGVREGLAQMQTFRVFQDSQGYIWATMNDGVSRFDGKSFRNYTLADLDLKGKIAHVNQYKESVFFITADGILFLHNDGSTNFYPMTDGYQIVGSKFGGRSTFTVVNNRLYIPNCKEIDGAINQFVFFIFDLENKTFEIIDKRPFPEQLHVSGEKLITLKDDDNTALKVYEMSGNTLILLREYVLDNEKKYFLLENIPGNELFLNETTTDNKTSRIYSYTFTEDNTFTKELIGEIPGVDLICRIDEDKFITASLLATHLVDSKQRYPFPVNTTIVNYAMKDRDGNLWLATEEGLINCYHLLFDSYKLGIKHNDYIWAIRKDVFDNIWFASFGLGFWRADKNDNITKAKVYDNGVERNLDFTYMDNAEDSLGRIFFATEEGLAVFDPRKGNTANLAFYPTGVSLAVYYDSITNCIFSGGENLFEDGWVTTLVRMNEQLETQIYRLNDRHIICICRDSKHRLRIGTYSAEYIFDEENEVFIEDTVTKPYRGVAAMKLDRKGFLWKATKNGVYAEDPEGNLIEIQKTSLPTSFLTCYDERYIIWGFADKLAILDLQAFHKDTNDIRIRMFDRYDGYDVMEAGQNGNYTDKDGYVWTIGHDKVLRFHPDKLVAKQAVKISSPSIAAIFNKDKDLDWKLAPYDTLIFENRSNNFRFDLLQASIAAPDKLIFRYRLKGYSDHWSNTHEHSIVFQNLPYGQYSFEVQSSVDDNEWSESTMSPLITVKRPFWLTLPGISILSIGIVLLLFIIIYWVRKVSIKKQEENRQIERLKSRAVRSKFIPHFTGNVLNSINYLISKDPVLAQKYIVDFSDFSRQTLLYSEKLHRTLKEELDYIELYLELEKMRFEDDLDYSFYTDPSVDMGMMVPMMILQTFCENAMKHGLHHKDAPGFIKVEVLKNNDSVVLAVEDNGIGRENARLKKTEGSREGLNIVNEQLKMFNKINKRVSFLKIIDLFDDNAIPSGTRFELHIPVSRE
jgi:Putative regulator of cell autolysis